MKNLLVALLLWPGVAIADDVQQVADASARASNTHICLSAGAQFDKMMKAKDEHGIRSVKIDFRIGADGVVKEPAVSISSDDPLADALAVTCVKEWRYKPATKGGQPVETTANATVSLSTDESAEPHSDEFDVAASNPAAQSCKVFPGREMEMLWSSMNGSTWSKPAGANDSFECVHTGNNVLLCRAKPGMAFYPTIVTTTFYSTGTKLKLGVEIQASGDCNTVKPVTFKDKLPQR